MSRFQERLAELGYRDYEAYLRSEHWRTIRRKAGRRANWMCSACGAPATQIHHRTYERLGAERLADLVALCGRCHERVHELAKGGRDLGRATDSVVFDTPLADPKRRKRRRGKKRGKRRNGPVRPLDPAVYEERVRAREERRKRRNEFTPIRPQPGDGVPIKTQYRDAVPDGPDGARGDSPDSASPQDSV